MRKISPQVEPSTESGLWARQALIVGFAGLIFGLIPTYGAGYSIYLIEAPINARLALGTFPGAALVITALLEILVANQRTRLIFIAALAALLIGWHVRYTNDFRNAWPAQVSFYRQLTWRAPGMAANTALISDRSIFPPIDEFPASVAVEGDFPTALAVNLIYAAKSQADGRLPYWFFPTVNTQPDLYGEKHVSVYFSGQTKNALLFSFAPQNGECLHILRPKDLAYRRLPDGLKQMAASASLSGIETRSQADLSLLNTILGPENTDTWCYFYEKADLAKQKQDWAAIAALWDSASQKGFHPSDGREYMPFVEMFIRLDKWEQALELTRAANKITPNMADLYCPLWGKLTDETPPSNKKDPAVKTAQRFLECAIP
jgi:hypothetical protein